MRGDAGLELREELAVAEHGEVGCPRCRRAGSSTISRIADALVGGRQPHARRQTRTSPRPSHWVAAEDEVDRRQHVARRRVARRPRAAPACTACAGRGSCSDRRLATAATASLRRAAARRGSGGRRRSVGSRCSRSCVRSPTRYRFSSRTGRLSSTTAVVEPRTVVIHSASSSALLTVADRQTRRTYGRQVDDDLLPHRTAVGVLEEVHLVEHDEAEVVQRPGARRRSCCGAPRSSSRPPARRR